MRGRPGKTSAFSMIHSDFRAKNFRNTRYSQPKTDIHKVHLKQTLFHRPTTVRNASVALRKARRADDSSSSSIFHDDPTDQTRENRGRRLHGVRSEGNRANLQFVWVWDGFTCECTMAAFTYDTRLSFADVFSSSRVYRGRGVMFLFLRFWFDDEVFLGFFCRCLWWGVRLNVHREF